MSKELTLELNSPQDGLKELEEAVDNFSGLQGWPVSLDFKIKLILEEIILNALNYGHPDKATNVYLKMTDLDQTISIEIVDDGKAFNPLEEAPTPDTDAPLEDRPIGGLGVYLVKSLVSDISYEWKDEKNALKILVEKTTQD